jgi:hypothetical protein
VGLAAASRAAFGMLAGAVGMIVFCTVATVLVVRYRAVRGALLPLQIWFVCAAVVICGSTSASSGHAPFGTAAHRHQRADFSILVTGSLATIERRSFYAGLTRQVVLLSRRQLRAFACCFAVLDAGAPPAIQWHGSGLPPEKVGADHGLAAAEDGGVEESTAGAASCVVSLWLDLARQSGGVTTLLPAPEWAGLTRLQSNAIGCIPVEGVTMSEPSRLLGSSTATVT